MLRAIVPGLRRVAVIGNPEHAGKGLERAAARETGQRLGLDITFNPTRSLAELEATLARLASAPPQAISVFADGFAVQHRLPLISGWLVSAEARALCIYGPRLRESCRRLANYVDRLRRGDSLNNNPEDLLSANYNRNQPDNRTVRIRPRPRINTNPR